MAALNKVVSRLKAATFNVWNNASTWSSRKVAIIEEIIRINADIVALQEVPNLQELKFILKKSRDRSLLFHAIFRWG